MVTPSLYIGDGLHFCTSEIQASPKLTFGGRSVVLIDTPGFNDAVMEDGDAMKGISAFLATVCVTSFSRCTRLTHF